MKFDDIHEYLINLTAADSHDALIKLVKSNYVFDSSIIKLATVASQNATYNHMLFSKKEKLKWAQVAIISYEILSKISKDSLKENKFSEMNMRARMILDFGVDNEDDILNADTISEWCMLEFRNVPKNLIERVKEQGWTTMHIEEIKKLRQFKNCLTVCAIIKNETSFSNTLNHLISLKDDLP